MSPSGLGRYRSLGSADGLGGGGGVGMELTSLAASISDVATSVWVMVADIPGSSLESHWLNSWSDKDQGSSLDGGGRAGKGIGCRMRVSDFVRHEMESRRSKRLGQGGSVIISAVLRAGNDLMFPCWT
jgi:hypothetical protein